MIEKKHKKDTKNKTEVKSKVKKVSMKKDEEEPYWYHYVIVTLIFALVIVGLYYLLGINKDVQRPNPIYINNNVSVEPTYNYTKKIGNAIYKFEFDYPVSVLENYNPPIEVNKFQFLNSSTITFSFLDYKTPDRRYVTTSSVQLMELLSSYFHFKFSYNDSFKWYNESNCSTSTIANKVVVFNPYMNETGVFYNQSNGCIMLYANTSKNLVKLTDKFMYDLINE